MKWNLEKGKAARVLMISGDEEALRRSALKDMIQAATGGDDDFDLEQFDADSRPINDWIGSVSTAPFLAEKRTVIVRHIGRSGEFNEAKSKMAVLPESARLVLVVDDEQGDENRQRKISTNVSGWERAVQAAGGMVALFKSDPKSFQNLVREAALESDKTISPKAVAMLQEMTAGSLSSALQELEKLILFVGDDAEIRESHVKSVVTPNRDWNTFRMIDAVFNNQPGDALRQLRMLISSPTKAEDAAQRSIFPAFSKQLKLIWQARVLLEARAPLSQVPPEVAALLPERPNLLKEGQWLTEKVVRIARQVNHEKLQACFEHLAEADARMKGVGVHFNGLETLEQMLHKMIASIHYARTGAGTSPAA